MWSTGGANRISNGSFWLSSRTGPICAALPLGFPFRFDTGTLRAGLNLTLTADLGWIDLPGEMAGGGGFEDVVPHSITIEVFGVGCRVLDLETLIRTKCAAGRPRDFEVLAELETLGGRVPK